MKKAELVYRRMTSFANYSQMNGIEKSWFLQKINDGLKEAFKAGQSVETSAPPEAFDDNEFDEWNDKQSE